MTAGCFYQNYREVRLLIIHCSATRYDRDFPVEALRASHKARGFADIGYHFYITIVIYGQIRKSNRLINYNNLLMCPLPCGTSAK